MRNIWKGLIVGAATGAAIGLALDLALGAGDQLADATREVRRRAPEAADWAADVIAQARQRLRESDLPEQVRSLAETIADSDLARQVSGATAEAAVSGRRAVRSALNSTR